MENELQTIDFEAEFQAGLENGIDPLQLEFFNPAPLQGFDAEMAGVSNRVETQLYPIKRYPRHRPRQICYDRAVDMVHSAGLENLAEGERVFCLLSGNFIFGDLFEAFLVENNWLADELLIATLSMSQQNADSLSNLVNGDYLRHLGLIVSDFWYAHERVNIPYLMDKLGSRPETVFRFAAAGLHTKIALLHTGDRYFVLYGSANLRSSGNLEQLTIERSEPLYQFNRAWMDKLLNTFQVRRKSQRRENLWQTVTDQTKNNG